MIRVTAFAPTYNLTLRATAKAEMGLTDSTYDALLDVLIPQASGMISSYCNRVFAQETVRETLRRPHSNTSYCTPGEQVITLARYPVVDVVSLTLDGTVLVEDTDFEVDIELGQLIRLTDDVQTTWHYRKLVIEYIAGYELLLELPYEIERACISLVKDLFAARERDPLIKSEEVPGVLSTTYVVGGTSDGAIPAHIATMIDPYRVLSV